MITYYNEKELLTKCLESLRSQTVPVDEIIIHDDASAFPAQDYIIPDLHINIIRSQKNCGHGFARNLLLQNSKCDYVHCHDADDLFDVCWCEKVREAIQKDQSDIIITEIKSFDEKGIASERVMNLRQFNNKEELLKFVIMSVILPSGTTFKREIALKIDGYRTRETIPRSEGYGFHVRMVFRCNRYSIILEPLILKYLRKNAIGLDRVLCYSSIIKTASSLKEKLPPRYHQYLAEYCVCLGSCLFHKRAIVEAKEAFRISFELAKPKYILQRSFYRVIAKIIGPLYTEYLAAIYRRVLPEKIRDYFSSRGW